jgi:F-box/WD-40 domain protein MET30
MSSAVNRLCQAYQELPESEKQEALEAILRSSSYPQLSYLFRIVPKLIRIDFMKLLPAELCFRIIQYLDSQSLCHAAQVSKEWKKVADNDKLWERMCSQHISKKCAKCGWGLPRMGTIPKESESRPWKRLYSERMAVERNWRKPQFTTKTLTGHSKSIISSCYDASSNLLFTGSLDHTVRVWDITKTILKQTLVGHTSCITALQTNTTVVLSGSMDSTIRIWSLETFQCTRVLQETHGVLSLALSGSMLACGLTTGVVKIRNFSNNTECQWPAHNEQLNKVRLLGDNKLILTCSNDGSIKLWNIDSKTVVRCLVGHTAPIVSVAMLGLSNDYTKINLIVSGSLDNTIKVWDCKTGKCEKTLFGHMDGVWTVDADSLRIVSGSRDKTIKVWDVTTGLLIFEAQNDCSVNSCILTDTMLICCDSQGLVTIRDFLP